MTALLFFGLYGVDTRGEEETGFRLDPSASSLDIPASSPRHAISISADEAVRWQDGPEQVLVLRGNCRLRQGDLEAQCDEAVVWTHPAMLGTQTHYMTCYLESNVSMFLSDSNNQPTGFSGKRTIVSSQQRLEHWTCEHAPQVEFRVESRDPIAKPSIWERAQQLRSRESAEATPAQFSEPVPPTSTPPTVPSGPGLGVKIKSRGTAGFRYKQFTSPNSQESINVSDGGVRVEITDEQTGDVIQISADRIVAWSPNTGGASGKPTAPREIYLEGNVDYRHRATIVQAERMFYNVAQKFGTVLRAEFLTPLTQFPNLNEFQGYARLKADVLQQLDADRFVAQGASFTTSRLGVPGYWVQADQMTVTRPPQPSADPTLAPALFSTTVAENTSTVVNSRNNFVYVGGVPVLYWPRFNTDLTRPTTYLESIAFNNDRVFGTQFMTTWDLYQVFGVDHPPANTDWNLSVDYLSKRGIGLGTDYSYGSIPIGNLPGTASGYWDIWGISDHGLDNLGADRRAVPLEEDFRGRIFGRHRHVFEPGLWLNAEVGVISDRNFLEQYFESEWDQLKDQTTGLELRRLIEERSWSLSTNLRVNDFFTETEWLPRLDHFTLGKSLLGDNFTWYEHSHIGYGRLKTAEPPTNPVDILKFDPLAWETPSEGIRAATRQEIDLPFSVGPVKFVPYALGELAYWQEDITGSDETRAYGQVGLRNSLPLWRLDQDVHSILFNLNGLAHKVVLHTDAYLADSNRNFEQFPLYDNLDDDSIEFFRRRMLFDTYGLTFGGDSPAIYDERRYALRRGMQSSVTSPTTEIADDLAAVRMGIDQRWQTKRGRVGEERIIDWITFDLGGTYFPDADRDNFGESVGLLEYDLRWHVGDRVTIVSDGYADLFNDGLKTVSIGSFLTRPGQAQFYSGFRHIDGPFTSHLLTGAAQYRLSEKWVMSYSSSFDLGPTGNIGQTASITRVGESFLTTLGFAVDSSRGNLALRFSIWPRLFSARSPYGAVAGIPIAPVGVEGLE